MEQLFTAIHDGDHSAHLIEELFTLAEWELIVDSHPLTTVERTWSDFLFIRRSENKKDDTLRIGVHVSTTWDVYTFKKVVDWATWKVEIYEESN